VENVGIQIALISARPPQGVEAVVQLLGIPVHRVCYLGAVIQDSNRTELQRLTLDMAIARDIAKFADAHGFSLTITIADTEYHTQNESRPSMTPSVTTDSAERILTNSEPPVLLGVVGDKPSASVYEYCQAKYADTVHVIHHINVGGSYISALIVHPAAEKGKSLIKLCRYLSIETHAVLAIGDSESDTTMFRVAGLSVAVHNADPETRRASKIVAPYPYGRGVAWGLRTFVLGTTH
jgi:hydroxymethylpyrimidine pyrophosphatase-like HAD family hydrolase